MSAFPFDPDYDFGDCHHIAMVPELSPDASQEQQTKNPPVPGDAGSQKESTS